MEFLTKIQFFIDEKPISPHDLHCDFENKVLTYNMHVESNYLDNHDGRFHFTAQFSDHIICDVSLHNKKISVISNLLCTNSILFDGFLYTENGREQTKPIFLKSLENIRALTNDLQQIQFAEESKPEIEFEIYKCQGNKMCSRPYKYPYQKIEKSDSGNSPDAEPLSLLQGGSKAAFVESSDVNVSGWRTTDCKKAEKILSGKIVFTIVDQIDKKIYNFM